MNISNVNFLFIITVAWDKARKEDKIINDFLTNLVTEHSKVINYKFILLVTKCDIKKNKEDVFSFVKNRMPLTFSKINFKNNVFISFSIGKVIAISDDGTPCQDDIISSHHLI
uniref:hypothetical protein n=1 Tax=Candidatus Electronema sp. TaxID=2698783 RepID=UPI004056EED0